MAQRYTAASDTSIGDRVLNGGNALLHLSTGAAVFLVYDPGQPANQQVQLQYVGGGHTSNTTLATIDGTQFAVGALPQALAICRDASDNVYVVGQDATQSNQIGVQAFAPSIGIGWTPARYLTGHYAGFGTSDFSGFAMVWCNTGGGPNSAGHLIVLANTFDGKNFAFTINAGAARAGDASLGIIGSVLQAPNPAFMGVGGANLTDGSNLDISRDGFGATYGLAVAANDATHFTVGSWGVTPQGAITTGQGMAASFQGSGTLGRTTTKLRIARISSGVWAVIAPSANVAGQLTVLGYTAGGLQASVDTGTPSPFPSPSASLSWDVAVDASGTLWIYGWSTSAATTMIRLAVTFANGVPTIGGTITDDTAVGSGTPTTIRVVRQPVNALFTDWQAYKTNSPYGLLGDYSALISPPNLATLGPPLSGALVSLATGGTVAWTFSSPNSGDAQTAYYLRRQAQPTAAIEYWNAGTSSWQNTEVSNTSAVSSVTFGTGKWTAATTYAWSVDVAGSTGLRAGYASNVFVRVATSPIPATPTLTASYDATNNRVTLTVAGTGTLSATVQYSDDSGSTWNTVRATPVALVAGAATVYDYEAPPGATRQYRAFQTDTTDAYGAPSLTSTVQSVAVPTITSFWLRDPAALSAGVQPHIRKGTFSTSHSELVAVHQPLNRQNSVAIADTYLRATGQATFWTQNASDETALWSLLTSQKPLLLQAPDNTSRYIRITSPRPVDRPYLLRVGTYRGHAVSWITVDRP